MVPKRSQAWSSKLLPGNLARPCNFSYARTGMGSVEQELRASWQFFELQDAVHILLRSTLSPWNFQVCNNFHKVTLCGGQERPHYPRISELFAHAWIIQGVGLATL